MANEVIDIPLKDESDVLDLLNKKAESREEDETKEDEEETKEEEPDAKDEDKDSKEDSEEDSEEKIELEKEDDLESELVDVIPRRKEILAKYPDLFKTFPSVEKAIYREQKYAEVFPTLDDAKEAQERAGILSKFEENIFSGDINTVLGAVKEHSPEVYSKIIDSYLENLHAFDEKAYSHVFNKMMDSLVNYVWKNSDSAKDDETKTLMKESANLIHQMVFGTGLNNYKPVGKFGGESKSNPEADKLKKEREDFETSKFETARTELQGKVDNVVKSTIDRNIDPKDQMSAYVKKNATKECAEKLEETIDKDVRFKAILDKLWIKAKESKYSSDSIHKIRSAYLSKAQTLLPEVIRSIRNEALKGSRPKGNKDDETPTKRLPIGRSASSNSGKSKKYDGGDVFKFLTKD